MLVRYNCGCIGISDETEQKTLLIHSCEIPQDPLFEGYLPRIRHLFRQEYEKLSEEDESEYMEGLLNLVQDGKRFRKIKELLK